MAVTPSTMVPLGTPAPTFTLEEPLSGERLSLADVRGERGLLVAFICNHCPYVIHIREALLNLASAAMEQGIGVVAINANDATAYPQDGPDAMAALAREEGWPMPFLFDSSQDVARAYRAACTPDFFLYDEGLKLFYRGQFDDSRPGSTSAPDGRDLRAAIEALLEGGQPPQEQRPSMGCNIKWAQ